MTISLWQDKMNVNEYNTIRPYIQVRDNNTFSDIWQAKQELLEFWLPQDVLLDDGFEAGHVPQVEEGQTDHAGGEEGVRLGHEELIAFRVEPGHDDHPEEEGEHVDVGVDPVLGGELVNVTNQMEDPGLVEYSVDLWDEDPEAEAHASVGSQYSVVAGHGRQVMDGEKRVLLEEDHLHGLHGMDAQAEEETERARPGGGREEIRPDVERVVKCPDRPQAGDASVDAGEESRPPLVVSGPAGPHRGARGQDEGHRQAAHQLYQGTQQEDRHSSQVQGGEILAEGLQLREVFWVSEIHCCEAWDDLTEVCVRYLCLYCDQSYLEWCQKSGKSR